MHNPFKKHIREHGDLQYLVSELMYAVEDLTENLRQLREEVDYLVDVLDTDD